MNELREEVEQGVEGAVANRKTCLKVPSRESVLAPQLGLCTSTAGA